MVFDTRSIKEEFKYFLDILNVLMSSNKIDYNRLSKEELLKLDHNPHEKTFHLYLGRDAYIKDKQDFLFGWIKPKRDDYILECGSSSGKTCIDFVRRSGCKALGVDFDQLAVKVSNKLMKKHFPGVSKKCTFVKKDLEKMHFDRSVNKVVMADFTEHIPNRIFKNILDNIRKQLPGVALYIYTPLRTHLFEIMKHRNIILKNTSGHINVKTKKQLIGFLKSNQWGILDIKLLPSFIPIYRGIEQLLIKMPFVGLLFSRKIAVVAKPLMGK